MKTTRIELIDLASWDNLLLAFWKTARKRRFRKSIQCYWQHLELNLLRLQTAILNETAPVGYYRRFVIHDPKRRDIHAACLADRILHHAILNHAEHVFERKLVDSSYACRPGKGVHRAIRKAQNNCQRYPWYVQVDVDSYFPSIDHQRMLTCLSRCFRGTQLMGLLERILNSYHSRPGKGLPIGSLTSQHFANLYLDQVDRCLLSHHAVSAHIRYMDDMVCWCTGKHQAKQILRDLQRIVHDDCLLVLKPSWRIQRSNQGLGFCGVRILPATIRLSRRKQKRYRTLRQRYESAWLRGELSDQHLQSVFSSIVAGTHPAECTGWQQKNLHLYPDIYHNDDGCLSKATSV